MFRKTPLEELEQRLAHIRAALGEREWIEARLLGEQDRRLELDAKIEELEQQLRQIEHRLAKLETGSIITYLYDLLGRKSALLDRDRTDLLATTVQLDEATRERTLVDEAIAEFDARLAELGDLDATYQAVQAEKQRWLDTMEDPHAASLFEPATVSELFDASDRQGSSREWIREIDEAAAAAKVADRSLATVADTLVFIETAAVAGSLPVTNWLVANRNVLTQLVDASAMAEGALARFWKELADIRERVPDGFAVDSVTNDPRGLLFFGNFVTSWIRRNRADEAIRLVASIRDSLGSYAVLLDQLRKSLTDPSMDIALQQLELLTELERRHGKS